MQRLTPHFTQFVRNVYRDITPEVLDGYRVNAVREARA